MLSVQMNQILFHLTTSFYKKMSSERKLTAAVLQPTTLKNLKPIIIPAPHATKQTILLATRVICTTPLIKACFLLRQMCSRFWEICVNSTHTTYLVTRKRGRFVNYVFFFKSKTTTTKTCLKILFSDFVP